MVRHVDWLQLGRDFLESRYLEDHLRFENWLLGARQRWWGHADALHYARCWRALKDVQSGLRIASEMGHHEWEVGDYRFRFRYPTFPSLDS